MDLEARIGEPERMMQALHVEQSAHHFVPMQVPGTLAKDRTCFSINEGSEQALGIAQALAVSPQRGVDPTSPAAAMRRI